jgi:hypothetical protein
VYETAAQQPSQSNQPLSSEVIWRKARWSCVCSVENAVHGRHHVVHTFFGSTVYLTLTRVPAHQCQACLHSYACFTPCHNLSFT